MSFMCGAQSMPSTPPRRPPARVKLNVEEVRIPPHANICGPLNVFMNRYFCRNHKGTLKTFPNRTYLCTHRISQCFCWSSTAPSLAAGLTSFPVRQLSPADGEGSSRPRL